MARRRLNFAGGYTAEEVARTHLVIAQRKLEKYPRMDKIEIGIHERLREVGMDAISDAMYRLAGGYGLAVRYVIGTKVWVGRSS